MCVYLPDDAKDAPIIIVGEVPTNRGESVTSCIERIVAEVILHNGFSDLLFPVVIQHRQKVAGVPETFSLVTFAGEDALQVEPASGEAELRLGEPDWEELDRKSVEALVGGSI